MVEASWEDEPEHHISAAENPPLAGVKKSCWLLCQIPEMTIECLLQKYRYQRAWGLC